MTHDEFTAGAARLGSIFSNLDNAPGATLVEWYRVFRGVPADTFDEAVTRAIARHERSVILPAHMSDFVNEVARDRIEVPTEEEQDCTDPDCPRCGGTGFYEEWIDIGPLGRRKFNFVCPGASDDG